MSKYQSIFEVQGKIGGTTFQKRNGKMIVGKTGGVSKERIETEDDFKRTRENMGEFGGGATTGKSLRNGLANVTKRFADGRLTARLTKVFRLMVNGNGGIRGKRAIEILMQRSELIGQDLDVRSKLSAKFVADYTVTVNLGRNVVSVDVPPFNIDALVNGPRGATHWQLVLAICVLSDHVHDATKNKYVPVDLDLNERRAMAQSALIPVEGQLSTAMQLMATLPGAPVLTSTSALVVCLGIEFSQEVGGAPYVLAQDNAMRIVEVF